MTGWWSGNTEKSLKTFVSYCVVVGMIVLVPEQCDISLVMKTEQEEWGRALATANPETGMRRPFVLHLARCASSVDYKTDQDMRKDYGPV